MRRLMRGVAVFLLLLVLVANCALPAYAGGQKKQTTRAIAIAFDNSGSMYISGNQAWCRATYAMEVFATMLNEGDTLMIYPMHPIKVDGKKYDQKSPLTITDPSQASQIRKIYTEEPLGTPIECPDAAAQGLRAQSADEKWLIVLTDGDTFDQDGQVFSDTAGELGKHINTYTDDMSVLYLGIGGGAQLPAGVTSERFNAEKAADSKDILSVLTKMCNQIFGRDVLSGSHNENGNLSFDISMKKLIVFVQGENVSNVSLDGGTQVSSFDVHYAENGCGKYTSTSDPSLQGVLVTYEDVPAGDYTVSYSGSNAKIDVYYEPDADLSFVFTNSSGSIVNPDEDIYEGEYKVSYGMMDAKTGELIDSDLLGEPHYVGYYTLEGKGSSNQTPIEHTGMSGEEPIDLKISDCLYSELTVTYLSGYTITKTAKDFGWPADGLRVVEIPPDELRLEITGGDASYPLTALEEGSPYTAKVFYGGEQLTGSELEKVELKWDPDTSNAEVMQDFRDDHYDLSLHYKDPASPQTTACGECTVTIHAFYTAPGSGEAEGTADMTYNIEDDTYAIKVRLSAEEDYYQISKLDSAVPLRADLSVNGASLTDEQLATVNFTVNCSGIDFTAEPLPGESAYAIQLKNTDGLKGGEYKITCTANYVDDIGRESTGKDSLTIKLGTLPTWLKWVIVLGSLLLLLLLITAIRNIKVLPKDFETEDPQCEMSYANRHVEDAKFRAERSGKQLNVVAEYGNEPFGLSMDLQPGQNSRVKTPKKNRYGEANPSSLRVVGVADVKNVDIDGFAYSYDKQSGKLVPDNPDEPFFTVGDGSILSWDGTIQDGGKDRRFSIRTVINNK